MTQNSNNQYIGPHYMLVRDFEKYDDEGALVERDIPVWTLIDQDRDEVICRGSIGPTVRRLFMLSQNAKIPPYAQIEYVYRTALMQNPTVEPHSTTLPFRDLMNWLESVERDTNIGREMYVEEEKKRLAN